MHKHLIPLIDEQFGNKCNWAALNGDIFMTDKKSTISIAEYRANAAIT